MRPYIKCKRHDIVKIPSVILAEYEHELAKSEKLRMDVKANIERENQIQKEKFKKMKEKYDREGVEYIKDEIELAEGDGQPREKAMTRSGARKPGQSSSGGELNRHIAGNVNMGGADNNNQKNPLSMIINASKKMMGGD